MESGPVPEADVTGLGIVLPLVLSTSTTCDPAGRFSYCAEIEYPEMDWKLMIGEAIFKTLHPKIDLLANAIRTCRFQHRTRKTRQPCSARSGLAGPGSAVMGVGDSPGLGA